MVEQLDDILEDVLESEAVRVTFEWTSSGELEVALFRGTTGIGEVLPRPLAGAIMREIVTRAKLERRTKGALTARLRGREMKFVVEEYDHFGDSAFEFRLRRRVT